MILSTDFIHIRIFAKNEKSPASEEARPHFAGIPAHIHEEASVLQHG